MKYSVYFLVHSVFLSYFAIPLLAISTKNLPPVIFIPGDGGSQLEAKLNKSSTIHYYCEKQTKDYFVLWLSIEWLLPLAIDCWVDNIKLNYDNVTKKTFNQPGVETRVPGFGDPSRVEFLDPSRLAITGDYFKFVGEALTGLGYQSGINLHGAPFDFRKGPSELGEFFSNLTSLIESTYLANGKRRVILTAHSMGGPLSLVFLQGKSQSWKDKYIQALVSLAGAYAGSVKALKAFTVGDDLGVYLLNEKTLKQVQVTLPSSAFLMPHRAVWGDEVLVQTDSKNYTLQNIEDFFIDLDYPTGWEMYQNERVYNLELSPPGVEVHCLYGQGLSTIQRLIYKTNKFPDEPIFSYEDGDGTVNLRSLRSCLRWSSQQRQRVHAQGFDRAEHMLILKDQRVIDYITDFISDIIDYNSSSPQN